MSNIEKIVIEGGKPLHGDVVVSGAKNSVVGIIFACILIKDKVVLHNVPLIGDVDVALSILKKMGAKVDKIADYTVEIDCTYINQGSSPNELVNKMRASYYLFGAELGRFGRAHVGITGGCDFGERPIDQHIKAFKALGAAVDIGCDGTFMATTEDGLKGGNIYFDVVTVGATINLMIAAVCAKGNTVIENVAREPHIVDLANFLNSCGANIKGAGTGTIKISGVDVDKLHGTVHEIVPDMIEAGTYMIAAAVTGGNVTIKNVIPKHLESITSKFNEMGVNVIEGDDYVIVKAVDEMKAIKLRTQPYPGFPTDMQPQMCVMLCHAKGKSSLIEDVWENRFRYIEELKRMGAKIKVVDDDTAVVEGVASLKGAKVRAVDLRAGAAMVLAGLSAQGKTSIEDIGYIERGYDNIVEKLKSLGADITKIEIAD